MKKFISLLLILTLVLSASTGFALSAAKNGRINKVKEILSNTALSKAKIGQEKRLYNAKGEFIAYLIEIEDSGYFILSAKSNTIIEYSIDNPSPYIGYTGKLFYNGFGNYYVESKDKVINLLTKTSLSSKSIQNAFLPKEDEYSQQKTSFDIITNININSIGYETNLSSSLKTWSGPHYCVVDSCAIMLEYFDRIHSSRYVPNNYNSNGLLQDFLVDNKYIPNAPQHLYEAVEGQIYNGIKYTGLNDYLDTFVAPLDAYSKYLDFDFYLLKDNIESDKPVIIAIRDYNGGEYHAVVAHGTIELSDGSKYVKLNDTFGRNNVNYIVSSDMDQMLWFD